MVVARVSCQVGDTTVSTNTVTHRKTVSKYNIFILINFNSAFLMNNLNVVGIVCAGLCGLKFEFRLHFILLLYSQFLLDCRKRKDHPFHPTLLERSGRNIFKNVLPIFHANAVMVVIFACSRKQVC